MKALVRIGIALALLPALAAADVGPPAHMQITERDPGLYFVQWRVPKALPPRAVPEPVFPETCRPVGERTVVSQPGAWLFSREWRCETGLAGQVITMRYPFPDLSLTTVIRVDLLSGDRFAHVLTPGEEPWRLPEGTAAPDLLGGARRAVIAGASHVMGSWVHLVFLLLLSMLGGYRRVVRLVSAFTIGQVAGALIAHFVTGTGAAAAEISLAVCVAVLARQALEPPERRRSLWAPVAAAGLAHGLGMAALLPGGLEGGGTGLFSRLIAILGTDAAHLAGGMVLAALWTRVSRRPRAARIQRAAAYSMGAAAVALGIALAVGGGAAETGAVAAAVQAPGGIAAGPSTGLPGSQRVAPSSPDAPVQSFVAVEPFEIRHEAMILLAGLAGELGLDIKSTIEIDSQRAISERLGDLVLKHTTVLADGEPLDGVVRRADFMTVDQTGALPRPRPVPEAVSDAVVGVVVVYPTDGMPRTASFRWERFPAGLEAVPATVIDPEAVRSGTLSDAEPSLIWENNLVEDPIPTVAAIEVEPFRLHLPWLSLPLLAISAVLAIAGIRGRRRAASSAAARVALALAIVVGPLIETAVALPGSAGRTPSERQARRMLAGLLPNIYRAMEFRDEATIYDRLAVSVTGETLTDVYLGQRRALKVEERGGAQARVEAVEVIEAVDIEARETGFRVRSAWTVGGMVTHFGHRHFRQNRYNARIEVVPVAGTWKIKSIEVLDQERLR